MVEIKDNLQAKLDKHYYPLIEMAAKIRNQLPGIDNMLISPLLIFDTTDQLRENIIYHEAR